MSDKKSFILYADYLQHIELLADDERGRLFTAILNYAETGIAPKLTGAEKIAFSFIRAQMERDAKKYDAVCERNRINGAKGGRPPKPKNGAKNPT